MPVVNTYMDERLLAAGNTLIRYLAHDETVANVPVRAGKLTLTEAGSGAIVLRNVPRLVIEPGYTSLRTGCIVADSSLKDLELPASVYEVDEGFYRNNGLERVLLHRRVSAGFCSVVRENSYPLYRGIRLISPAFLSMAEHGVIRTVCAFSVPPLPDLHPDMRVLFAPGRSNASIFDTRPCYDLLGRFSQTDEYAEVMAMIQSGAMGWRHPEAERRSDLRIRKNERFHPQTQLSLAILDRIPNPDPGKDDDALIMIFKAALFTPRLLPIRLNGNCYYLYSRNRLTSDRDCPYQREDVCIFNETGLVTDQKISEAVYGKARLLMLL